MNINEIKEKIFSNDKLKGNKAEINKRLRRYGLTIYDLSPLTYEEIAFYMGLSKQRIQQIENIALKKIKFLLLKIKGLRDYDIIEW
jgi:DNA-directed RNA polymerase sigma subunit (sigma70/sigma32)